MIVVRRTVSAADTATPPASGGVPWYVIAPLLLGTFMGTVNNNIVTVPLNAIARDLGVGVGEGALVVIAFNITVAALMPLAGWAGDRIGRRRVFCYAVVGVGVGALGASFAPNLATLVLFRALQGAASASVLPAVLGIITELIGVDRRGRAVGLWAGANGLGQAVGPLLGGLITGFAGWRWIFAPTVAIAVIALLTTLRFVPSDHGRAVRLEWRGAASLTGGAALLLTAAAAVPITGLRSAPVLVPLVLGMLLLLLFWRAIHRVAVPFIPPSLLAERAYLRSSLSAATQMFCLGVMLLGVPLYLTRAAGVDVGRAGLLVFALPALMTMFAPVAGFSTERLGGRITLRAGLSLLLVSQIALGVMLQSDSATGATLVVALAGAGVGVALIQTSAATGATRSMAGRVGAGLGLFNLLRFAGSGLGAAWVAGVLSAGGAFSLIFAGASVAGLLGLIAAFLPGREEQPRVITAEVSDA
ncbi:MAG: MFS transporter [Candidatus Dormiibacterota bacterium]